MLNDKIEQYWTTANNPIFLEAIRIYNEYLFIVVLILVPISLFSVLIALISLFNYATKSSKNSTPKAEDEPKEEDEPKAEDEPKEEDSKEGNSGTKKDIVDWLIDKPVIMIPLGVLSVVFFWFIFGYSWSEDEEHKQKLATLKEEITIGVIADYLSNYNESTYQPKETIISTSIHPEQIYKTSFMLEGELYNDQLIYVTYSEDYKTNTLIPFNATNYQSLLPTSEQKENNSRMINSDDIKVGFRLRDINGDYIYLDDIDFVYNVKIRD